MPLTIASARQPKKDAKASAKAAGKKGKAPADDEEDEDDDEDDDEGNPPAIPTLPPPPASPPTPGTRPMHPPPPPPFALDDTRQERLRRDREISDLIISGLNERRVVLAFQPVRAVQPNGRAFEEALAHAGDPGPVLLRRLNNAEFTYTVRDLTGVPLDPAPADQAVNRIATNNSSNGRSSPSSGSRS